VWNSASVQGRNNEPESVLMPEAALSLSSYDSLKRLHLEPTTRCQASCPMCARNNQGGRTLETVSLTEITLENFRQWVPDDLLKRLYHVFMCGNLGEPILARDCLPMFEHMRRKNSRLSLGLNTNGSARTADFWQDLARLDVRVNFAIDGATAVSHQRYRRGTEFDRILENAGIFTAAGGRAVWDFLVFRHNEHEVEEAQAMAKRLGFEKFVVKPTERFNGPNADVLDQAGTLVDRLEPSLSHQMTTSRVLQKDFATCQIDCMVARESSVFIDAGGNVFPCCFLGYTFKDRPGRPDSIYEIRREDLEPYFALIDRIGEHNLSLRHRNLRTIMDRFLPEFMTGWGANAERLPTCAKVCGKAEAA
jgi:MoaA/NifB/PqqE/SkfB family radical SAM enzyme